MASFFTLYFLTSWMRRLALEAGYPLVTAITGGALFNLGAFLGLLALACISARMEIGNLIAVFFALAAIVKVAFGAHYSPVGIYFAGMIAIGFLDQGGFGGLYAPLPAIA